MPLIKIVITHKLNSKFYKNNQSYSLEIIAKMCYNISAYYIFIWGLSYDR